MTPAGSVVEFPTPSPPFGLAAGPDGNLWFTERATGTIARITPAGVINEFPLPAASSSPGPICAGPDGNIWFLEANAKKAGSITP